MQVCAQCGQENPEGFRFCGRCAAPLASDTGRVRETRKVVTALFCDVTGSSALGERLDPESLRRVMARYFDLARSVIEHHGGTVEKFIGDAVMAVFGVPVVHEDDALRAVRAAAELRERMSGLNRDLERDHGVTLLLRTGVNTGEVVAGTEERLATGDAVVVAQRLEAAAPPGEVLVGEATLRLVRDAVEVEPAGPLELRGKARAVTAYRLLRVRAGAPGTERRTDSPLVGRERELRRLRDAFETAEARASCELFTVLGAAGVGKSRLVAEFLSSLDGRARVISGRCLPYGEGITFWPLGEALREAAGVTQADTAEAVRAKLAALAPAEDAERVAADVAPALGLDGGAPGELPWAARKLLESLARSQPLVVVFDDVHWGEPAFLDLVEHVADWSRDAALFLLCVARPELLDGRPGWGGGKLNATTILLEPLSDDETRMLLANLLGGGEPVELLRRRVTEAAEGNPLFVEELLAMLLEEDVVGRENGSWVVRGDLAAVQVPPTIQALLAARLDHLERPEREVLERAAVEGKVFHAAAVVELSTEHERAGVPERLRALLRKELIRPDRSTFAGDEAFRFRHLLIRDAAYAAIPKSLRAELHERFAYWLESRAADRVAEFQEIAGYHLEQAYRHRVEIGPADERARELAERAGERLAKAGARAAARTDPAAAAALLGRAAELLAGEDVRRVEVLLELGRALNDGGDFARGDAALDEAAALATTLGETALGMRVRLAQIAGRMLTDMDGAVGQMPDAVAQALPLFERLGDDAALAETYLLQSLHLWLTTGAQPAAEAAERGVVHARRAGDRRVEAELRGWANTALVFGPLPVEDGIERARATADDEATSPHLRAHALNAQGVLEAMRGNFDEGRRLQRLSVSLFRELGHDVYASTVEGHGSTVIELLAGDAAAAERRARRSYDELGRMGEVGYRANTAAYLSKALTELGRFEEALELAEAARGAAGRTDLSAQFEWRAARGRALAGLGRLDEARACLERAVEIVSASDFLHDRGAAQFALARVLAAQGETAAARALGEQALAAFEAKGVSVEAARTRAFLSSSG